MPKVELTLEQIAHALNNLTPGELETLEIMLDPKLRDELKGRWEQGKKELKEGKVIPEENLFGNE